MFKKIRREDRELSLKESEKLLEICEYGVLSTVNDENYGYGVPLNYVYLKDTIYFHCAFEGHKIENILKNNKVSFCVVGKTSLLPEEFSTTYESAIIFGRASQVSGDEKEDILIEILKKYSPEYLEQGKKYIKHASSKQI